MRPPVGWVALGLGRYVLKRAGAPPEKGYSQGAEESLIRRFFGDRRGGVFVDVGAGHWEHGNNTYYLERELGWSGIAVDARAEFAEGYRASRPRTTFYNYIVTDHSGTEEPFYLAGNLSATTQEHLSIFDNVDAARAPVVSVPTITLTELLDAAGLAQVDLLCMDIEQSEPAALAGFAISRFRPQLVCVEVGTNAVRRHVTPYFAAGGYTRIDEYLAHDIVNWYFRRRPPGLSSPGRSSLRRMSTLVRRGLGRETRLATPTSKEL